MAGGGVLFESGVSCFLWLGWASVSGEGGRRFGSWTGGRSIVLVGNVLMAGGGVFFESGENCCFSLGERR